MYGPSLCVLVSGDRTPTVVVLCVCTIHHCIAAFSAVVKACKQEVCTKWSVDLLENLNLNRELHVKSAIQVGQYFQPLSLGVKFTLQTSLPHQIYTRVVFTELIC